MKGLILKDLLTMRKYLKTLGLVALTMLILGASLREDSFAAGMGAMMAAMTTIVSFSYDESIRWGAYGSTLPLSRGQYIAGKYLLALLMIAVSALAGMGMTVAAQLFGEGIRWLEVAGAGARAAIAGALVFSLMCPCICRFGLERSRLILMVVFLAPTALAMFWARRGGPQFQLSAGLLAVLPWLTGLALAALMAGSYLLSRRIYEKKDF